MDKIRSGAVPIGNVVFEAYIGNTRCIICDDCCVMGEETRKRTEQSKINIGRLWYESEKARLLNPEK